MIVKGKSSLNHIFLDWTPTFELHFDLTNMYSFKVNVVKIESDSAHTMRTITKPMFVNRETTMMDFYMETASMLTLMKGQPLDNQYSTIVYALRDNRLDM